MNYKELDNLVTFKMGVPSLYHIMLGMSSDETEEYQTALDEMNTDNYDLNDFLKKYDITVERTAFTSSFRLHELTITIPLEHIKENDVKMLFNYFACKENVLEKKFSFTSDTDDSIKDLNMIIHFDLFDVIIKKENNVNTGDDYIVIMFVSEDDVKLDKLRCLAVFSNNEKSFMDEVFGYVNMNSQINQ
jgi:hypothetical protein